MPCRSPAPRRPRSWSRPRPCRTRTGRNPGGCRPGAGSGPAATRTPAAPPPAGTSLPCPPDGRYRKHSAGRRTARTGRSPGCRENVRCPGRVRSRPACSRTAACPERRRPTGRAPPRPRTGRSLRRRNRRGNRPADPGCPAARLPTATGIPDRPSDRPASRPDGRRRLFRPPERRWPWGRCGRRPAGPGRTAGEPSRLPDNVRKKRGRVLCAWSY